MYTICLRHENYLEGDIETSLPTLPVVKDWIEIPPTIRRKHWPDSTDTLWVAEREYLFDESMNFYGVRLYLQDWEGK